MSVIGRNAIPIVIVCVFTTAVARAADDAEALDNEGVYRMQPGLDQSALVLVPSEEIKPGLAYNYYHSQLGRRVWGFASGDGSFQFAFGEGTVLSTEQFDLRLSAQMQTRLLEQGAPGLEKSLASVGGTPAVRLGADGNWTLLKSRSSTRVFDLVTGHRWEWHGKVRKAVLHTYGDRWQMVDGRYRPATGPVIWLDGSCPPVRAGSAVLVVRWAE